jgi:3-carboxy-cis,cis-muconate cycloisomerase
MSIAAFDHPYLSGLVGDDETAALFGVEADIAAMLSFEAALGEACASHGLIPTEAAREITRSCADFKPDMTRLRSTTARDGVVVPELIRQLRAVMSDEAAAHVHFGATSQDVIDTSLMIRLRRAFALFDTRIAALIGGFDRLAAAYGEKPLMGYTRMQPALPITAGDRIRAWRDPLVRHAERLKLTQSRDIILQFGGAVGTLDKFGEKADGVRREMAERLSLVEAPQYHSQRDGIVEIASLLSMITGTLGKFGQDVALMAQARDIRLSGGGVSSAMAHKQNPVAAEVLVSLARFNAVQAGGMLGRWNGCFCRRWSWRAVPH